jgi:hypothetical protein
MTIQEIIGVRPVFAHAKTRGPYGWLTPHIAVIAAADEIFASRILALTREEQHFIAFIIALMGDKAGDADHMTAFARSYHRLTRRTLYEAFTDGQTPAAVLNLLPKLMSGVWAPAQYRTLASVFTDPQARKTLRHLDQIKRRHVKRLAGLPRGFRTGAVLKKIRDKRDLDEIAFAISAVRRIRPSVTDQTLLSSLEKRRDRNIRNWVMNHYTAAPFPPAPVGALVCTERGALTPLDNHEMLAASAREFRNCIRTYLYRVLRGDSYFYRYARKPSGTADGPTTKEGGGAIVELRRAPVIGWVVHEALGLENKPIKRKHRTAIVHAFSKAGIGAAPQAVNPKAWFEFC